MQVILQEDYPSLGFVGDVVTVRPGFARNFLFPRKIALPADTANVALFEHRKKAIEVKKARRKQEAEKYKTKVEAVTVRVAHAVAEGGRLFGSVSLAEIQEGLKKGGIDVDKRRIRLEAPIKTVGEHRVEIRLHQEVSAQVKVIVEPKEEKKKTKRQVTGSRGREVAKSGRHGDTTPEPND